MQSGEVTVKGILPYKEALSRVEKQLLENARNQFGSTRRIADVLGINQSTVSRKLRQYGLDDAKCITSKSGKIRRNRGIYEFKGTKVMHKNITFILFLC